MIKAVVVAITAIVVGFIGASWYFGTLPQVQQDITTRSQSLISLGHNIYLWWASLPSPLQKLVLALPTLISTAFMTFFAWTKLRAMQKLQQVEQQANADITQLSGEKQTVETQAQVVQEENQTLKDKLKLYENFYETHRSMEQKISTVEQTLPVEIRNLETRVQGDISTLNNKIKSLAAEIERAKRVD